MFQELINKIQKEYLLIVYKLLNDLLLIGVVFLFFMLLGESLLPGALSSGMKFPAVIIAVILDIILIRKLAKYLGIQKEAPKNPAPSHKETTDTKHAFLNFKFFRRYWASKKALWIGALVFSIFILNSLIKLFQFNLFLGIFIFLLILMASYFIYKLAFEN